MKQKQGECSIMKKYVDEGSDFIRECIGQTIISLMKIKDFENISVSEICKVAHIGRTTFYRYFGTKNGKTNSLYFWLLNGWNKLYDKKLLLPEQDEKFLTYLYSIKNELMILNTNGFSGIIYSLILEVYGAQGNEPYKYLKYAGAGIWLGVIKGLLDNRFNDSQEIVLNDIRGGIISLLSKSVQYN